MRYYRQIAPNIQPGDPAGFEGGRLGEIAEREGHPMATHLEIADFLRHITKHPEDFEIDEITEILKEAAEIIYTYALGPTNGRKAGLQNQDPGEMA